MDVLTKLIQQAARKPGVGEVRICYFDTSPPSGHWTAVPGRRCFATAQAAMRAADKLLAKTAG
jgi:hypothetical protein